MAPSGYDGEERLDAQLLQRHVLRRADRGHEREVGDARGRPCAKLDRQQRQLRAWRSPACARPVGMPGSASTSSSSLRVLAVRDAADRLAVHALHERLAGLLPVGHVRAQRAEHQPHDVRRVAGGRAVEQPARTARRRRGWCAARSSGGPSPPPGAARGARAACPARRGPAPSRVVEAGLAVLRRVAGGEQHLVALAQRDVERAGELEHHLAARVRAAGSRRRRRGAASRPPRWRARAGSSGAARASAARAGRRGWVPRRPTLSARVTSLGGNCRALVRAPQAWRHVHHPSTAPASTLDASLERNIGFIPNLAARDRRLADGASRGFVGLQTALRSSTLSGLEREVVGVTVARFNDCAYSLAAHSKFARMQGGDEAMVAALRLRRAARRRAARGAARVHARAARGARARPTSPACRRRRRSRSSPRSPTRRLANYAADVVGRADRRGLRLAGTTSRGSFRTAWIRTARRLRAKGCRAESPSTVWESRSDEARYRDRPSREDERGAGSPLPRRGTRVLDEQGAGSRW